MQRYPSNAYLLLDDSDGEESYWNMNRHRENTHSNEMHQQRQQKNRKWEIDVETTTTLTEAKWETIKEPYDNGNYWGTSTPWYWDTAAQSYWKETTPTYWDISTSSFRQTFTDQPFWRENLGTVTTTTASPTIHTTGFTTTSAPRAHEVIPDVTEELIWERLLVVTPAPSPKPDQPLALPMKSCPHRFDAVTRGKLRFQKFVDILRIIAVQELKSCKLSAKYDAPKITSFSIFKCQVQLYLVLRENCENLSNFKVINP